VAAGQKSPGKAQNRHARKPRHHLETDSMTLGLHTQAQVQHFPTASVELKTNSTKAALNATAKSHQQHGPTAKAGIRAVQWLQMVYLKSRRKIDAMVKGQEGALLAYFLGFAVLVCLPMMIFMAYLGSEQGLPILAFMGDGSSSAGTHYFWHRRLGQRALSPRAAPLSRTDNHRHSGGPSSKCASPSSGGSFPHQQKQDQQQQQQQQHKQQHKHLPILPLQSREQSRQHKATLPPTPAEDVCQEPCINQELRVPEGKECCLLLPWVKAKDIRQPGRCTMDSPDGAAVFSLIVGNSWSTASHGRRLLTLQSAVAEGVVFASCDAVVMDQGEPVKLAINDRDGKHFADMQTCGRDKTVVMLASHAGPSATIRYDDQVAGRIEVARIVGKGGRGPHRHYNT